VRYEAPVCEAFQARHGCDARQFPDSEPRLQALWAELVTGWLRELRVQLDAAGPAPGGGRRELVVITGADLAWNARFGFAVPAWAEEKLVDAVLPYPKPTESTGEINVAQYARALRGTGVPLLPGLGCYGDHRMTLAQIRRRAHAWYRAGADGLSRWDAHGYLARLELNDPVVQELWCEHYLGPQSIELLTVAGITLTTFGPRLGL
jgi:hypothetical protein